MLSVSKKKIKLLDPSRLKKYKLNLPIAKKVQELYAKTVKSGRANLDHSALYLFIKALSR
mgnify:CR=1 FL=1